jgi:hypothetical protein
MLGMPPNFMCESGMLPVCAGGFTYDPFTGRCLPSTGAVCPTGWQLAYAGALGPAFCVQSCPAGLNMWCVAAPPLPCCTAALRCSGIVHLCNSPG